MEPANLALRQACFQKRAFGQPSGREFRDNWAGVCELALSLERFLNPLSVEGRPQKLGKKAEEWGSLRASALKWVCKRTLQTKENKTEKGLCPPAETATVGPVRQKYSMNCICKALELNLSYPFLTGKSDSIFDATMTFSQQPNLTLSLGGGSSLSQTRSFPALAIFSGFGGPV
jgi:hypothetical protein